MPSALLSGARRSDLVDARQLARIKKAVDKATGADAVPICAPTSEGIPELLDAIVSVLGSAAKENAEASSGERPWSPL